MQGRRNQLTLHSFFRQLTVIDLEPAIQSLACLHHQLVVDRGHAFDIFCNGGSLISRCRRCCLAGNGHTAVFRINVNLERTQVGSKHAANTG